MSLWFEMSFYGCIYKSNSFHSIVFNKIKFRCSHAIYILFDHQKLRRDQNDWTRAIINKFIQNLISKYRSMCWCAAQLCTRNFQVGVSQKYAEGKNRERSQSTCPTYGSTVKHHFHVFIENLVSKIHFLYSTNPFFVGWV